MTSKKILFLLLWTPLFCWAEDLTCPPSPLNQDGVEEWRSSAIKQMASGEYGAVKEALTKCFPGGPPSCMNELTDYLEKLRNPNQDDAYTLEGSSGAIEDKIVKSEKDLPPEFSVPGKPGFVALPKDILSVAKAKGWKAIAYKTRSTGGFDNTPNLTLVAIPGDKKDVYLQISPPPDHDLAATKDIPYPANKDVSHGQNTLTVITVDKTQSPPVGQLRLMSYDQVAKGYRWNNNLRSQSCTNCHTTPLRSISPRGYHEVNGTEKKMKPEDEKTVEEINEMMTIDGLSWGQAKIGDKTIKRGPPIDSQPYGWAPPRSKTREEDFIKTCSTSQTSQFYQSFDSNYKLESQISDASKIDHKKVGAWMNCSQCHNGTVRGTLHSGFSKSEIQFKILVDRSMPPGADLTRDERIALYNCIVAEQEQQRRGDVWKKRGSWMKAAACEDLKPVKPKEAVRAGATGNQ